MRTTAMTVAVVLAFSLAMFAAPQTAPSQPQVPPTAQSSPSTGSAQTAPSSSPSSNTAAPSNESNPGAASNSSPGQAHQPGDWVAQQLNLTQDQQDKLRPILADEIQQMRTVRDDTSLSDDQKREKMNQIRQTAAPKIQAILTPEQRQKLGQLQEQARQQREQQNGAASPQTPPQKPPQ